MAGPYTFILPGVSHGRNCICIYLGANIPTIKILILCFLQHCFKKLKITNELSLLSTRTTFFRTIFLSKLIVVYRFEFLIVFFMEYMF